MQTITQTVPDYLQRRHNIPANLLLTIAALETSSKPPFSVPYRHTPCTRSGVTIFTGTKEHA